MSIISFIINVIIMSVAGVLFYKIYKKLKLNYIEKVQDKIPKKYYKIGVFIIFILSIFILDEKSELLSIRNTYVTVEIIEDIWIGFIIFLGLYR